MFYMYLINLVFVVDTSSYNCIQIFEQVSICIQINENNMSYSEGKIIKYPTKVRHFTPLLVTE